MTESLRVHIHGVAHFSRQIPDLLRANGWQITNHDLRSSAALIEKAADLGRCDLVFTYGGRVSAGKFLAVAKLLGKNKLVMFWAGSDVLHAKKHVGRGGSINGWIRGRIHWASSPWIAEEVRSIGLSCEYVPFNWAPAVEKPAFFPKQFSVLTYLPDATRSTLYGVDQILEVARSMPHISFVMVGLRGGRLDAAPPNLEVHGWTQDLTPFYERSVVLWRPVRHDGMSFMVLAALAHGRHVIYSYPLPGCIQAISPWAVQPELERLRDLHQSGRLELNEPGRRIVGSQFAIEIIRAGVLRRWKSIIEEKASEAAAPSGAREQSGRLPV